MSHIELHGPAKNRRLVGWRFGCANQGCEGYLEIKELPSPLWHDSREWSWPQAAVERHWVCWNCGLVQIARTGAVVSPVMAVLYELSEEGEVGRDKEASK